MYGTFILNQFLIANMDQDIVVAVLTCYGQGFNLWWGRGVFSFPEPTQTKIGFHPDTSSRYQTCYWGVTLPGHGVDHTLHLVPRLGQSRVIPLLSVCAFETCYMANWAGQRSRYSDCLRAGQSRDRIPVGARFSAPVQTGPEAHPASCTMGTGCFPGVRCARGVSLTPHPRLVPRSKIEQRYTSTLPKGLRGL